MGCNDFQMTSLRSSSRAKGRLLLALVCAALAMKALIPAGYMIAPSANHVFAITPCPSTNPLARVASGAADQHAAMGHAAIGQGSSAPQDQLPVSAQSNVDCAFSALAFAGTFPEKPHSFEIVLDRSGGGDTALPASIIVRNRYLRPPLRGPPSAA